MLRENMKLCGAIKMFNQKDENQSCKTQDECGVIYWYTTKMSTD